MALAKRSGNSNGWEPDPILMTPKATFVEKLESQIVEGKSILESESNNQVELDDISSRFKLWDDYNNEYLRRSFDRPKIAASYRSSHTPVSMRINPSLRDKLENLRARINARCVNLQSLLNRIDLIPESDDISRPKQSAEPANLETVFIVHGHDDTKKTEVARLIEKAGLNATILHEQPNMGRTIIEKFEDHAAEAGFAVVIATADDQGAAMGAKEDTKPRARQNVILELGYFTGRLRRKNVCLLYEPGVELPSDMLGVVYIELDEKGSWNLALAKEMRAAGLDFKLEALM